jgi:hypothetical protein
VPQDLYCDFKVCLLILNHVRIDGELSLRAGFGGSSEPYLLLLRNMLGVTLLSVSLLARADHDVVSDKQAQHADGVAKPYLCRGISPAITMQNSSLPFRRRLGLSTFCEAPETRPRKRAEVTPTANVNRVSGRNLCRQVPDSWAQFRASTATGPRLILPGWLAEIRTLLEILVAVQNFGLRSVS